MAGCRPGGRLCALHHASLVGRLAEGRGRRREAEPTADRRSKERICSTKRLVVRGDVLPNAFEAIYPRVVRSRTAIRA